ncbi:hypothetical protein ACFXPW_15455 [Streptomyces goshikiensis]|uniref:hypothetical protein n=1 Tax=Streptomyces goshikiensis TaxID=1942 RepID=UPI003681D34D
MIEIRRAGPADGDALGRIHAAAWEAAYGSFFAPEFAAREVRSRRARWHARVGAPAEASAEASADALAAGSYTQLTLPTTKQVYNSVVSLL